MLLYTLSLRWYCDSDFHIPDVHADGKNVSHIVYDSNEYNYIYIYVMILDICVRTKNNVSSFL